MSATLSRRERRDRAWTELAWGGFRACARCGVMANCRGRRSTFQVCRSCFDSNAIRLRPRDGQP
jgi:hypothetical protein